LWLLGEERSLLIETVLTANDPLQVVDGRGGCARLFLTAEAARFVAADLYINMNRNDRSRRVFWPALAHLAPAFQHGDEADLGIQVLSIGGLTVRSPAPRRSWAYLGRCTDHIAISSSRDDTAGEQTRFRWREPASQQKQGDGLRGQRVRPALRRRVFEVGQKQISTSAFLQQNLDSLSLDVKIAFL
jgi:hypothetical protein